METKTRTEKTTQMEGTSQETKTSETKKHEDPFVLLQRIWGLGPSIL